MITKYELRQYRYLKTEIEQLAAERAALRGKTGSAPDGQPKGTEPGDVTGETAIKVAAISEKISAKIAELTALRWEIETAVESIPDSRDRLLMRKRYIEGKTWELIAVEMNYTWRWTVELHGRILRDLENRA